MITEYDLQEAIAECQGELHPNANTCLKLASYLTIRREMFGGGEAENSPPPVEYARASYDPGPAENTIDFQSGSEFSRVIDGRDPAEIWPVMDELMGTLAVIHRRLYDGVMRELRK